LAATEGLTSESAGEGAAESSPLPGARALLSLQALHRDLGELLDRGADLLTERTLGEDLLRKVSEDLHDLLRWMGDPGETARGLQRIHRELTLQIGALLALQIRIQRERALLERTLLERTLLERTLLERTLLERARLEWIRLPRKGRLLRAKGLLRLSVTAECAGLSKEPRSHLRRSRLRSGKLGHQSLRRIL